ncbi:hypothetical protein R1flu_024520 [Riccia fluitans]|uniref:Ubiquitin-like protease family profile domain-containing protein n=1 Tax=Riccia fluitans TaxID=41844 RepID=A0ABD1XW11_9MARC
MARSKKRARRQSTEVFDFDPVAIAMETAEEVTRAAIDPTVPNSQEATTRDISPATDSTQPVDNARGVDPNNIQQEDEDLQLIPPNGIPGSVKMDGKLVEPFNPDELERPRKTIRSNPSKKSDMLLPPNAEAEAPTPRKRKEKMAMQPKNAFEDEVRKELRELKEAITMNRQEVEAIARSQKETTTRLGQSSAGPSNHMEGTDVHRGQPAASLQTKSASMAEYRNTVARMLEECEWAVERNTSLEEELIIAERKIEELRQRSTIILRASEIHLDSYVNPDNNPDVQPLVKDLDAEHFDVDAFLGTDMGGRKEEMTPNFLDGLSVHDVKRLESEIENIRGEPQQITRATARLRLNYEQDVLPPPTAEENITDSTVVPIIGCSIDLTMDEAVDEPCLPPDRQIISVVPSQRVDLTTVVSPKANRCITMEWPCLNDLTKEDRESTYARKYLRKDIINAYIFEKFLQRSHEELFNMFYCSTFWFAKASQQVDAYDMTSHSESASIGIKRLRNAIYPQLRDGDFKVHPEVPTWIFVPIHGRCHWSLALIQLLGTTCAVTHLDSFSGIHKEYIFHVLRTFLRLTMPICPETLVCGTMEVFDATKLSRFFISVDRALSMVEENAKRSHSKYLSRMFVSLQVPHQLDQYSCGIHVIQMLAGAGMKGLGLDQCLRVDKLAWIATIDQVTTMGIMLSGWLNGKFKHVP